MPTLALFDFDGTLCQVDSFSDFISYGLRRRHVYRRSLKLLPHIVAYYGKLYPAHRLRPRLYRQLFRNYPLEQAQADGERFAEYLYSSQLHPLLLARLRWHQQQQHRVLIVSASLNLYLAPLAKRLGVELLCSEVATAQHTLTGDYATQDCSGWEKVHRLQQRLELKHYPSIYAYGNSPEDFAMLALADQPFWVDKHLHLSAFSARHAS
jgi:HAD superfamily hydrolase (TIGR01490 family)